MRSASVAVAAAVVVAGALVAGPTPTAAGPPTFADVSPSNPFYGHITWLAEEGIAAGYPDGGFRPQAPISRAAMAAFLHRVEGEPPPTPPGTATFSDVPTGHPFFAEVEWLAAEGITTGFSDGTFRPAAPTSRQAMAAYLHRVAGEPASTPPESPSFPDVPSSNPFSLAVEWLVAEDVATGFQDGRYHPTAAVSRQAMAAFLFRQQHLAPSLSVDADLASDLGVPWDVAFAPDGGVLFDDIAGGIHALRPGEWDEGPTANLTDPFLSGDLADFQPWNETGMTGLALDPGFAENRTFYTCQVDNDRGDQPGDVDPAPDLGMQVVSWTVDVGYTEVERRHEVVHLAQWYRQAGAHAGCRLRFGPGGHLFVSVGDFRCGTYPQDLAVRAGKVLRVDVDPATGAASAPADNPFVGGDPADDLVYSYGHRNPQGLAWRPGTDQMWSVEHGSSEDDEVNLLVPGANRGWSPDGPVACAAGTADVPEPTPWYDDGAPLTDAVRFPAAIPAQWSSGDPTIATSGAAWLDDEAWGGWQGGLAVATLKGRHLRVLFFTDSGVFVEGRRPAALDQVFGRLRSPVLGPDGDLFLTTSNPGTLADPTPNRIVRVHAAP